MKMFMSSKVLCMTLALAAAPVLSGCTDDQIAAGVAGGVIGTAIGIAATSPGVCVGGYQTVCNVYYDYAGYRHRECHDVYESCRYVRHSKNGVAAGSELPDESGFAMAFGMSFDSSATVIASLKDARDNKDINAILDLGLTRDDIQAMSKHKLPSDESLDSVAKNLDQNVDATRAMFQTFIDKAPAQAQAAE